MTTEEDIDTRAKLTGWLIQYVEARNAAAGFGVMKTGCKAEIKGNIGAERIYHLVVKPFGPVDLSGSLARLLGGVLPSRGPASWDELTDVTADGAHHFPPRLIHPEEVHEASRILPPWNIRVNC